MHNPEKGAAPEAAVEKLRRVTREEIEAMLERGEDLENLDMKDLELAGLNFEGRRLRGSDIRGACFYGEKQGEDGKSVENPAILRRVDFTDTTIGDFGPETIFGRVDAESAIFGFTEDLISRRTRHAKLKELSDRPEADDSGGLYNFNGGGGNFRKTKWKNIDFAGGSGYDALFPGADLTESEIIGSDISGLDWSKTIIDGIKIKDPLSLAGLTITADQAETLSVGIELSNERKALEFSAEVLAKGAEGALKDYFEVIIV